MIIPVVTVVLCLLYAVLIFYYYKEWKSLPEFTASPERPVFISVIIPARNEERNIRAILNAIKQQQYPAGNFETILVDDFSTDNTVAEALSSGLQNLIIIKPESDPFNSSKKKAIEAGISDARGELIVCTDADCIPGIHWLETINSFYNRKKSSFIAAPVKFNYRHTVLEIFQALDFMMLQGITAASTASDFHAMCNGANLAYKKQSFHSVDGFSEIDKVATGDDMLLMYKIRKAEPGKVHYIKSRNAIVSTAPMPTLSAFLMQRKRWASKTLVYDDKKIIAVLAFILLFNFWFLVLLIAGFFSYVYWGYLLGLLILKILIEYPFIYSVSRFYGEQKLLPYFPLFQPLHIFYTIFSGITSQFGKYEWKGRRTK